MEELQLELTTACNSNCIMCPRAKLKRENGTMNLEKAENIIKEAVKMGAKTVKLEWFGETLLVPYWNKVAKLARHKGMKVILITNGSLLNTKNRKYVLKYVDKIFISIDSHIKEDYEKIRKGLNYNAVISNLRALFSERGELVGKPEIIVSVVSQRVNMAYLDDIRAFFSQISDFVCINKDNINIQPKRKMKVICKHNVDSRLVVGWNGKCYLCCHDWLGEYEIGNLNEDSMKRIWNGKKRKRLLNNLDNLEICQRCMQL